MQSSQRGYAVQRSLFAMGRPTTFGFDKLSRRSSVVGRRSSVVGRRSRVPTGRVGRLLSRRKAPPGTIIGIGETIGVDCANLPIVGDPSGEA